MITNPRCQVCNSARRAEADAWVRTKAKSYTDIARELGIANDSGKAWRVIQQHVVNGHVAPTDDPAVAPKATGTADTHTPSPAVVNASPSEILRRQLSILEQTPTDTLSPHARATHADQIRRIASDLARVEPPVDRAAPLEEELKRFRELFRQTTLALEKFPEARVAVAAVLDGRL